MKKTRKHYTAEEKVVAPVKVSAGRCGAGLVEDLGGLKESSEAGGRRVHGHGVKKLERGSERVL